MTITLQDQADAQTAQDLVLKCLHEWGGIDRVQVQSVRELA